MKKNGYMKVNTFLNISETHVMLLKDNKTAHYIPEISTDDKDILHVKTI